MGGLPNASGTGSKGDLAMTDTLTKPTEKLDHRQAHYIAKDHLGKPCKACTMFLAPDACSAVKRPISPEGHCKLFKRRKVYTSHLPSR